MVIVIMGAAGAGKSTVGRALALAQGWSFHDADDWHPRGNIDKMRRGVPLDDEDRRPWLETTRQVILDALTSERDVVIACSALRERHRQFLTAGADDVRFVFLRAAPALLHRRLTHRPAHFAPVELLESQLAALEPPADALTVDAAQPVAAVVDAIRASLGGARAKPSHRSG